jgi:hypothetical protein
MRGLIQQDNCPHGRTTPFMWEGQYPLDPSLYSSQPGLLQWMRSYPSTSHAREVLQGRGQNGLVAKLPHVGRLGE